MGFLDRFRKKGEQQAETKAKDEKEPSQPQTGKRIKKYTSDGKPIYE